MGAWNYNPGLDGERWERPRVWEDERVFKRFYRWGFTAFTFDPNGPIERAELQWLGDRVRVYGKNSSDAWGLVSIGQGEMRPGWRPGWPKPPRIHASEAKEIVARVKQDYSKRLYRWPHPIWVSNYFDIWYWDEGIDKHLVFDLCWHHKGRWAERLGGPPIITIDDDGNAAVGFWRWQMTKWHGWRWLRFPLAKFMEPLLKPGGRLYKAGFRWRNLYLTTAEVCIEIRWAECQFRVDYYEVRTG